MPKPTWLIGALSLVSACSSDTATNPGPVAGTQYDVTERGVEKRALDPTDGTFEEPLQISPDWVEMRIGRSRQAVYLPKGDAPPDLTYYHFGRSGVEYPTRQTNVGIDIAGLEWQQGDSLQLVSPNVGGAMHALEVHFRYPTVGATAVTQQTMDWAGADAPLIDSALGDSTWIAQMSSLPMTAGSQYSVLTRAGLASGFTVREGADSALSVSLQPVAKTRSFDLHWQGSAFAALAAQAGPGVSPAAAPALAIRTMPEALVRTNNFYNRFYMYLPSLVDFGPVRGNDDFVQHLEYGNPFSTKTTKWSDVVTMVYAMPVTLPEGASTYAMIVQASPVDALENGTFAPAISPVRDVRVNGEPADTARSGGASPTISWSAPSLGTATNYTVTIQALTRTATGATLDPIGTFNTRATSIKIPDVVLKDAASYVVTVTAIAAKDRDFSKQPFLGTLPYASADYVTATITR